MTNSIEIGSEKASGRASAVMPRRGAVREWLPVPAPAFTDTRTVRKSSPVVRSIWLRLEADSKGEKLLLGLLTAGAIIGIGYGFSCLLDLVQNWAGFHSGIAQLIH